MQYSVIMCKSPIDDIEWAPFHSIYEIIITRTKFDVNRKIHKSSIKLYSLLNLYVSKNLLMQRTLKFTYSVTIHRHVYLKMMCDYFHTAHDLHYEAFHTAALVQCLESVM